MFSKVVISLVLFLLSSAVVAQSDLRQSVAADYEQNLHDLFVHFHENPELSHREFNTSSGWLRKSARSATTSPRAWAVLVWWRCWKTGRGQPSWSAPIWMACR